MLYPSEFESKIGFDNVRTSVSAQCESELGKNEVSLMKFSSNIGEVRHWLVSVHEMCGILRSTASLPLDHIYDLSVPLKGLHVSGRYIDAKNLHQLGVMLETVQDVCAFFQRRSSEEGGNFIYPELAIDFSSLQTFPNLVSEIWRVINKYGDVKDDASPRLKEIRQSMRMASGAVQRAMKRVLERSVSAGVIDRDTTPAVRDGRLVIPVAAQFKRSINGIVHDESATGKTIFIEPAEVVEASNRLRELENEEKREIISILVGVADIIRPYRDSVIESCRALGFLDFIRAKARYALSVEADLPHLSDGSELEWYHAEHPVLLESLKKHGQQIVPLDITLDKSKRILIISGPNAGGKSVCLKTVAIVQYMAQCGLLPTLYSNSHLGIFRSLFIDIGDEQSIENDLSTYSSHLRNMKFFLTHADRRTLLLADEMGSGTEPQIGGALAQAILKKLGLSGCFGVVTTHYQNLKTFADETEGFVNGAMLYDRQHLQPTFQLSIGTPGSSFALDIASKTGIPRSVIEDAKEIVGSDYVNIDKYLSEITRDRRYWNNKRLSIKEKEAKLDDLLAKYESRADELKSTRNQLLRDARNEAKEILAQANSKIERTILEIRNAQAEKEKTKEVRRELEKYKAKLNDTDTVENKLPEILRVNGKSKKKQQKGENRLKTDAVTHKEISVGDFVKLDGGSSVGKVLSVDGAKAEVVFGSLRTRVETKRLSLTTKPKETLTSQVSTVTSATEESSRKRQLNFSNEIDVRGMRADEALQAVTYFIDDAIQFSASRVRILHGTGHGILKTLIREQLRGISGVRDFHDEDVRFGGAGITVVEF